MKRKKLPFIPMLPVKSGGKYDALAETNVHATKMGGGILILFGIEDNKYVTDYGVAICDPRIIPLLSPMLRSMADGYEKLNKMAKKQKKKGGAQ